MQRLLGLAVIALAFGAFGCSEKQPATDSPSTSPSTGKTASPEARITGGGTIEARVTYAGAPVIQTISVNKDVEQCGHRIEIDKVVVGRGGGLSNAVVSVVGLEGPPTARTPKLDQHGCQFRPHVIAIEPGKLEVRNSDGILHNLHTYSEANPTINKAQPKFKKVMDVSFEKPDIVKVTCDVHSWMQGWVVVLPNPYFGVTDTSGVTRIEGVPPGPHTVEVWHEALGKRTKDVTVKSGETTSVVLAFPKSG
jgi:plastocyanin